MSCIAIFNGSYCFLDPVVEALEKNGAWQRIDTLSLIEQAAKESGMNINKFKALFSAKESFLDRFVRDDERAIAWLKKVLAEKLMEKDLLITGPAVLLIPSDIGHVLKVCLISALNARIKRAVDRDGLDEADARKKIEHQDIDLSKWTERASGGVDPWAESLYDMVQPMDSLSPQESADQIAKRAQSKPLEPTELSEKLTADFLLLAKVEAALTDKGRHETVAAENGKITLTVNHHTLMFKRLASELTDIATSVDGVDSVEVVRGEGFYKADIISTQEFSMPSKVLLVDDERKFVKTLSERLVMRDLGATVAYDGASALEMIEKDAPEVMVLDLKMPGMSGIDVLREVQKSYPDIAVIILTGHGSELDRQVCMELGAVDYLHKPVKMEVLSASLEKAAQIAAARRNGQEDTE